MLKPSEQPYEALIKAAKPRRGVRLHFAFDAFLPDFTSGAFLADQLAYLGHRDTIRSGIRV